MRQNEPLRALSEVDRRTLGHLSRSVGEAAAALALMENHADLCEAVADGFALPRRSGFADHLSATCTGGVHNGTSATQAAPLVELLVTLSG